MNEGYKATARACPRLFVYEPRAFLLQILQGGTDVFDAERDVMDTTTAFLQKL
jgi:hypothetical protein